MFIHCRIMNENWLLIAPVALAKVHQLPLAYIEIKLTEDVHTMCCALIFLSHQPHEIWRVCVSPHETVAYCLSVSTGLQDSGEDTEYGDSITLTGSNEEFAAEVMVLGKFWITGQRQDTQCCKTRAIIQSTFYKGKSFRITSLHENYSHRK